MNLRDNAQVDAVERKHDLSMINVMLGRVGNTIGGILKAPVTKAKIGLGLTPVCIMQLN